MSIPALMAYLNGQYAPLNTLQVSVMDRGFLFGDGVYELIPAYARRPFRLQAHLVRLEKSLAAVGIENPHSRQAWQEIIEQVIALQTGTENLSVYLQVSRGPAWPRNHAFPAKVHPTVLVYAEALLAPAPEMVQKGIRTISTQDIRWERCHIKACSLMANVLMKQMAAAAGVVEVILFRDGQLIEGSVSNIFIVRDGVILAPPPSVKMLTGITYDVVQELAQQHGLPLELRAISEQEVRQADEVWMTSSSKEVLAVVELDGQPVGNGLPGPIYQRMYQLYQEFKAAQMQPVQS